MACRPTALAVAFAAALALAGCSSGRRFCAVEPGVNQVMRVASGDRIFFEMEEDASAGARWDYTCDDHDVEVSIDHRPSKRGEDGGAPGSAAVEIRIHRGYDGPSVVTFMLKKSGRGKAVKRFAVTLFKRTGDVAFWE